jgi:hypothetical protein
MMSGCYYLFHNREKAIRKEKQLTKGNKLLSLCGPHEDDIIGIFILLPALFGAWLFYLIFQ